MPKAKAPVPPIRVIADHREEPSGVVAALRAMPGVEVTMANNMEIGDYVVGDGVVVERKGAVDWEQSIQTNRLFEQLARAKENKVRLIVMIEGDVMRQSRMHPNALIGAEAYVAGLAGSSVLKTGTPERTAMYIKTIAKHLQQGLGYELSIREAKPKSVEHQLLYFCAGLPGVGVVRARLLCAHFGSLRELMNAGLDEIASIPGIGGVVGAGIVAFLGIPTAQAAQCAE